MKEIALTQGKVAFVDDADFEAVSQFKWYAIKGHNTYYAGRTVKNSKGIRTTQRLHQFLVPRVQRVDHEDSNGLNNCRENLRPCTNSQNLCNSRKRVGTSQFKGVSRDSNRHKWRVDIQHQEKNYFLGHYASEEIAARAYDVAARKFHKEFARLNFP